MRFGIVYSKVNIASMNIVKALKSTGFLPQITFFDSKKDMIPPC